ncbi:AbrB/MazE/SpoVT family DNA-binding domain-containing protein [Luedemannella flava]|uniref:AbrB/MazE/SpoVT family DNA-binding domain-containing protein n=1 Tax=Luedemannella flava TaxID=349316 RepID=UPI00360AC52C
MAAQPGHETATGRAVLRARGQVTLPAHVRTELDLHDGDDLLVTVEAGRVVLTRRHSFQGTRSGTGRLSGRPASGRRMPTSRPASGVRSSAAMRSSFPR